jgi:PilZ domain-containing protein
MSSTATYESRGNVVQVGQEVRYGGLERRRSPRISLQWTLYLVCDGGERRFRTKTRDISPEGFYCVVDHGFQPGELLECDIVVPVHNLKNPNDVVYLRCRAQAVRVEGTAGGAELGLACRIEDYRVISSWGESSRP